MQRKPPLTPSGTLQSLANLPDEGGSALTAAVSVAAAAAAVGGGSANVGVAAQATPKSKRATSFIRKKPPLERGLSAQSALRINKNALVGRLLVCLYFRCCVVTICKLVCFNVCAISGINTVDCPTSVKDVSILVTEPSPECPTGPKSNNSHHHRLHTDSATTTTAAPGASSVGGSSTLVHVLVHRESEEYQTDVEDGGKREAQFISTIYWDTTGNASTTYCEVRHL